MGQFIFLIHNLPGAGNNRMRDSLRGCVVLSVSLVCCNFGTKRGARREGVSKREGERGREGGELWHVHTRPGKTGVRSSQLRVWGWGEGCSHPTRPNLAAHRCRALCLGCTWALRPTPVSVQAVPSPYTCTFALHLEYSGCNLGGSDTRLDCRRGREIGI